MISYGNHDLPGKLFVVEGTDGSGKSTQLSLLYQWLKAEGYPAFFSEWNSSALVKETTKRAPPRAPSSAQAVPATSRCAHGRPPVNSFKKSAAVIEAAGRPPVLVKSAISLLSLKKSSAVRAFCLEPAAVGAVSLR